MLRKGPEPYAVDCVLAYLDTWGIGELLLKADNETTIQALVDGVQGKRGERTMVEKSPKYSHQSNGAVETAVRRIESLTRSYVCVLQEKLAYKVDSKSIVLPWLVGHAAYVLSRFVKREDGRSAWTSRSYAVRWRSWNHAGPRERSWIARMKATRSSWEQQSGSSLLGRFGGARETNNGSAMHSRHSQVCPGIREEWRWRLRWQATGGDTSQSPSSNNTVGHQAVQHVWEFRRSTRRSAERDSSG